MPVPREGAGGENGDFIQLTQRGCTWLSSHVKYPQTNINLLKEHSIILLKIKRTIKILSLKCILKDK